MADEGQIIRGINWKQTFGFTNIFRSFRVAIHLSKLALGLALLLCIYFGGRVLDGFWPATARALPQEIANYEAIVKGTQLGSLQEWRTEQRDVVQDTYAQLLVQYNVDTDPATAQQDAQDRKKLSDLDRVILKARQDRINTIKNDYNNQVSGVKDAQTKIQAAKTRDDAMTAAYIETGAQRNTAAAIEGEGLFDSFFQYEIHQINDIVEGVIHNSWLESGGVAEHVYDFFAIAPIWLIWHHTVFFILFAVWFLACWALFGGAVSRMAAVHVARDEKISVRQAMNFSFGKLLSFASAPVIPILIVVVIGLFVALVALIGNIPFIGPIFVGALFVLALLAGFVMTLVVLGTVGGFNLMYPTIAVEGSDSFDAISRSFSYVYARPWRMLFYTAIAIGYGAATYMFVHMFIWFMLVITHHFVALGMFTTAGNGQEILSTMWASPASSGRLAYSVDYSSLTTGQAIGAFLINCWVMLLVAFLGAFAISLYFSANTIIYYLMRSEVDATEMDDVYLEQAEDDLEASAPAVGVTVVTATAVVSPAPPPPETPPAGASGT